LKLKEKEKNLGKLNIGAIETKDVWKGLSEWAVN